jgi:hypothetical protein
MSIYRLTAEVSIGSRDEVNNFRKHTGITNSDKVSSTADLPSSSALSSSAEISSPTTAQPFCPSLKDQPLPKVSVRDVVAWMTFGEGERTGE